MKKILIALTALFTIGIGTASAQQKASVAYINYVDVTDTSSTYQLAFAKSEEMQAEFEATMLDLQKEYETKLADYQANVGTMAEIIRQSRESELGQIQGLSEQLQQQYQQNLQIVQERYFAPLEKWLKEAVSIVGARTGYDYILYYDEANSIFWVNLEKAVDLSNEVITELLRIEAENPIKEPGQ